MLPEFPGRTPLLLLIAATPATVRWFFGRRILRYPNDAALPERMLAMRRRTAPALGLGIAALLVLAPMSAYWTLPLLLLLRLVVGYPMRRAVFGETWTLPRYLSFFIRLLVAVYGLWITIAVAPLVVPLAGRWDWGAAVALAALLLGWNARAAEITCWVLRSTPLADVVRTWYTDLARKAGVPVPRFEVVAMHGGSLANAAALPSSRKAAILFTDTLFARLNEAEATAICAHELAHLQYYDRNRVRRMHMVTAVLIVTGAALSPVSHALGISVAWLLMPWYMVLFGVAAWRARHRQRNETISDARAVELSGDAEALVSALTKLHSFGLVPRRLDPQLERQASHPSLARRIRDIRRAAGTQPAVLQEDAAFSAPGRSTTVTFQPAHVRWDEGDAATHTFSYTHLTEVRLATPPSGPATLIVVERGGRRWTMPLESDDVARAQAVLDIVDGQIGAAPLPTVWPRAARLVSAIASVLALLTGQLSAAVIAAVATAKPSSALLAAAGIGALTASALTLRDFGLRSRASTVALALLVIAPVVLALARAARGEQHDDRRPLALIGLAAWSLIAVAMLFVAGLDAISIHQSARLVGAATVAPLALAAMLLLSRHPRRQVAALVPLAAGAFAVMAASWWFLDRFGRDPFLVGARPSLVQRLERPLLQQFSTPFAASSLRLSPGSRAVAVTEEPESDEEDTPTFHIGTIGAALQRVQAHDLAFPDDEHVLLLEGGRNDLEIREGEIGSPGGPGWRLQLPALAGARLSVDPADRTWRVLGWTRSRDVVRLRGVVGSGTFEETRWTRSGGEAGYINAVAASGDRAVLVESRYDFGLLARSGLRFWSILPFTLPKAETRFWSLTTHGGEQLRSSRFGAQCVPTAIDDGQLACAVFDGTITRVMTIDPTGEVTPIASFTGRFFCRERAGRNWVSGWWDSTPLALRLSTGNSVRIAGQRGEWIADMGSDNRTAATITDEASGSVIRVYSLFQ